MEEAKNEGNKTGESKKTGGKAKKVLSIIGNVLIYVFFALCLVALVFTIFSKRDQDGTVTLPFGYQVRIVLTESMEKNDQVDVSKYKIKSIPKDSVVFVKTVPYKDDPAKEDPEAIEAFFAKLKEGDVLTFRYMEGPTSRLTITHRIIKIEKKDTGGYIISCRGDNGTGSPDTWQVQVIDTSQYGVSFNDVIGKVVGKSLLLGLAIKVLKNPIGIPLIIIVPCALIIIMQVVKIVNVINSDKRRKLQEETERQQSEMDALKKRLMELEIKAGTPAAEEAVESSAGNAPPMSEVPTQGPPSDAAEQAEPKTEPVDTAPAENTAPQDAAPKEETPKEVTPGEDPSSQDGETPQE